jgi:hypothetical protein
MDESPVLSKQFDSAEVRAAGSNSEGVLQNAQAILMQLYVSLGPNEAIRQASYRELFRHQLDPKFIDEIRTATNGNDALGSSQFQKQVSAILKPRVTSGRSGRPRAGEEIHSLELFTDG